MKQTFRDKLLEAFPEFKRCLVVMTHLSTSPPVSDVLVEVNAILVRGNKKIVLDRRGVVAGVSCGVWSFVQHKVTKSEVEAGGGTQAVTNGLQRTLTELGLSLDDLCRLRAYFACDVTESEIARLEKDLLVGLVNAPPVYHATQLLETTSDDFVLLLEVVGKENAAATGIRRRVGDRWSRVEDLNFSDVGRFGDIVFTSGQLPVNEIGKLCFAGDLSRQTHLVMQHMLNALDFVEASAEEIVMVQTFYPLAGYSMVSWTENVGIRCSYYKEPGPGLTGVAGPRPIVPGALLSSECIAVVRS